MRIFTTLTLSMLMPLLLAADTGGLTALPSETSGSNVVTNADFESGVLGACPTGFTCSNAALSSDYARSGAKSLKVGNGVSEVDGYVQYNFTVASRIYRARFWYRTAGANPGPTSFMNTYRYDGTHGNGAIYGVQGNLGNTPMGACGYPVCGPIGGACTAGLSGGIGAWTEYAFCDEYVFFPPEHFGDTAWIRFKADNIAAGAYAYIDDVSVQPLSIPLVIFPTYPNYRGMLWSDQGNTIAWKAVVAPPEGETMGGLRVDVEVRNGGLITTVTNSALSAVVTAPNANYAGWSVSAMSYDASGLADGTYYLRGKLVRKSDSAVLYTYPDYKIVKEAPGVQRTGWKAWVDRYNRAVLNGAPQFIWGGYLAATGSFNAFVPGSGVIGNTTTQYKRLAMGCAQRSFQISNITQANPAAVTMLDDHGMSSGATVTFSGGTGDWTGVNGQRTATVTGAKTFTIAVNTSAYAPFAGQPMTMIRTGGCYATTSPDQATTSWNPGFGDSGSSLFKIMAEMRMNTLLHYGSWFGANPGINYPSACGVYAAAYDQMSPAINGAYEYGIWTQVFNLDLNQDASEPAWAQPAACGVKTVQQLMDTQLTIQTTKLYDLAGFLGLYINDEPAYIHLTQSLPIAFDRVSHFTGYNKGGITYWAAGPSPYNQILNWNQIVDAHGADPYVTYGVVSDDYAYGITSSRRLGRPYWWTRNMLESAFYSRPVWTVPQLHYYAGAYPSLADLKISAVSPLAAGATGLLWWQLGAWSAAGQSHYNDFERVSKMIAELRPLLDQPVADTAETGYGTVIASVSDSAIKCSARTKDTRVLLACVNTTNTEKTVTITLAAPGTAVSAERVWDHSRVVISAGSFTDTFKGLLDAVTPENSVHLYVIEKAPSNIRVRSR